MRRLLAIVTVLFVLAVCITSCIPASAPTPEVPPPQITGATVVRVIDGDTIEVNIKGELHKVRYIGMDTPEVGQPGGAEATSANAELVAGKIVQLEKDVSETDRYGRLLRYVWVDGTMVNAALIISGHAQVITYPPDVKYQQDFLELQRQALEAILCCS
jgi:micrococcal nuclease